MAPSVGRWSPSTSRGGLGSSAVNGGTTTLTQRWRSLHGLRRRTESSMRPTNGLATAGQRSLSFFLDGNTILCAHCICLLPVWVMKTAKLLLIISPTGRTTPSRTTGTPPWGGRWSMRVTCRMAPRASLLLTVEWRDATTGRVPLQQSPSTVIAVPCLYQDPTRSTSLLDSTLYAVLISFICCLYCFLFKHDSMYFRWGDVLMILTVETWWTIFQIIQASYWWVFVGVFAC